MKVTLVSNVLKVNQTLANENRDRFERNGVAVVNMMSSPGAGKTTLLEATLDRLAGKLRIGVIEGDLFTTRDAERIERKGVTVTQINTEGGCHLDANMVSAALADFPLDQLDLLIIENVGNLVCPAEYDLGEGHRAMLLSVTEGNDKPVKYPRMFMKADAVVLSKVDLVPYTDFDLGEAESDLAKVAPEARVFRVSSRTGEGLEEWCNWLTGLAKRA